MFLKSLTISRGNGAEIRKMQFHQGLNLILDETPVDSGKETGNNVGKTTVLKLVDFCLGADAKGIYSDYENKRNEYKLVKEFLVNQEVLVAVVLKDDLADEGSREVLIERNFLSRKNRIQRVNGEHKTDEEFEETLTSLLFPGHFGKKPTFRQIIAHNIRYTDQSINNTLKNLDRFTRDDEYETLYLFLFGCDFEKGNVKQELRVKIDIEENFRKRLESNQTKSAYESALVVLEAEITDLEKRKSSLGLNPNFESQLDRLNDVKYQINQLSSEIGRLELRRNLIQEAQKEIESSVSTVDLQQLRQIYEQATSLTSEIQKKFEELQDFHNKMVQSKRTFISRELPQLDEEIRNKRSQLNRFLVEQAELASSITESDSYADLENIVADLNDRYKKKGEYENTVHQLDEVDVKLAELNKDLSDIDNDLFSQEFSVRIKEQVNKFNLFFSEVSFELYGEKYALKVDTKTKRNRRLYEFTAFNTNFSSGKKQGEISCFDIAYTLFADDEHIPCMHFLLNDKKELMHDNQLVKIAGFVGAHGVQYVASILKDKLPAELRKDEFVVLKLSQNDKLFRIESETTT